MFKIFSIFQQKQIKVKNKQNLMLFDEPISQRSLEVFANMTKNNNKGLLITRTHITQIKERVNIDIEKAECFWLACEQEKANNISPTETNKIIKVVKNFIERNPEAVIHLDGIEYLLTHTDPNKVNDLLMEMAEIVSNSESKLICSYNSQAILDRWKIVIKTLKENFTAC